IPLALLKVILSPPHSPGSGGGEVSGTVDGAQQEGGGSLASGPQTPGGGTDSNVSPAALKDAEGTDSSSTPPPANQTKGPKLTEEGEEATAVLTKNEELEGNPKAKSEKEQRRAANDVSVQQPEEIQNNTESAGETPKEGGAPIAGKRRDGTSDGYGESIPPSLPADSGAANKGTEEEIPREDSAADGAVTEAAQQGETGD
ncbi:mucin-associated surface protein (MASP), putative, partial [Trypanosoma cruzi marinkellei]